MASRPEELIRLALDEACSLDNDDLPIAAVVVDGRGLVLASSRNEVMSRRNPTAHAELLAIESVGLDRLRREGEQMTIAVTLEPCPMCAWAIRISGIRQLVFGAHNPDYGSAGSVYDLLRDKRLGRIVEVIGGVSELECRDTLQTYFMRLRDN